MTPISEHKPSGTARRFWRIAVLVAVTIIGTKSEAGAALYYWHHGPNRGSVYYPPFFQQEYPSVRHRKKKAIKLPEPESAQPRQPIVLAISIEKQTLVLYDADGMFAESRISTGKKGHSTPMGIFSVIQKQKFHRSNIYSGAPMPYMQRITWSGIAVHGGMLPGYPASHGCIRVPISFAVKLWRWTKLGARVVITPGETTPTSFSHPLLPSHKVAPQTNPAIASAPTAQAAIEPNATTQIEDRSAENPPSEVEPISERAGVDIASNILLHGNQTGPGQHRAVPPPARDRQVTAFISGKDSKLYVRQNFRSLFEMPVTIAPDHRPLGTHVFTAQLDPDDANVLHWSVVSVPVPLRYAAGQRRHEPAALPDGPAEALDRLTIPADAMSRIATALSVGGSIIISDQGIRAGDAGAGEDFAVYLH